MLDREFGISTHQENLVDWAVTDANRSWINEAFISRKTALMLNGSPEIERVYTSVFVTDSIVEQLNSTEKCLLVTHHNFDYHEDGRGLQAISPANLENTVSRGNSIYVAHAPLDTHKRYGTSVALAALTGVHVEQLFYDYFGSPTAVMGTTQRTTFEDFCRLIQIKLQRPCLTEHRLRPYIERIAVVAGGGDMPDILQAAFDLGCDSMLAGTVEHRWNVQFIQDANQRFHELNQKLKMNLIGGTHYGTERPAMQQFVGYFRDLRLDSKFIEDQELLSAK
jgi:putative NIF3 family GTP cyclohydrolase 1 type 2